MIISVYDKNDDSILCEMMEADEFLEVNGYDEEIEEALNELNEMEVGEEVEIYGNQTDVFRIVKEKDAELGE